MNLRLKKMRKNNANLYLPLVQALADGKTIEWNSDPETGRWVQDCAPCFTFSPSRYRIRPEPSMVPLEPEDVPPGSFFRYFERKQGYNYIAITKVAKAHLYLESFDLSYLTAMNLGEIKRPGEDWKPCSKIAP